MNAKEMIEKYQLRLFGKNSIEIPPHIGKKMTKAEIAAVREAKDEILAILTAGKKAKWEAEEKARQEAVVRLAANVPGLEALRDALSRQEMYREAFARMMDDEMNDGANPPQKPVDDIAALRAEYPAAAAYLKAENWECASHYAKSAAGRKAKQAIADGADYSGALAQMEAEWQAHTEKHIWD